MGYFDLTGRAALVTGAAAVLVCAPWLIKNWIYLKNMFIIYTIYYILDFGCMTHKDE